jgi:aryl-alcohol dehydrogenase-like predicted oxidoreductase
MPALTGFSEVYGLGKSERIIGDLIRETDEETRSRLYIATKCQFSCVVVRFSVDS